jgi:hypothetical protein
MLQKIASDPQVRGFVVVPTQGTLQANRTDWQNEIHPSTSGFVKIAKKFQMALDDWFSTPLRFTGSGLLALQKAGSMIRGIKS